MRLLSAQTVPSTNDDDESVCPDCQDPVDLCTCSWQIMQLDASYGIYTTLNEGAGKRPAVSPSDSLLFCGLQELDGLNCGGIPTRTTPTLTPTTLRTIEADLANLTPTSSENFAASAASDLHHLVSSSSTPIILSTPGPADRLNSDLQDRQDIQNLGVQHITLQNLNNQHINITNLQSHQHMNQNTLNQQQRNDYNNSFSMAASRQAGFVPPLVLQINSNNTSAQPPSGTAAVLLNVNNSPGSSAVFNAKGSSTSTSSSHWQGAVVTQRSQQQTRSAIIKQQFTDDEDGDEDLDSGAEYITDDSSDTPAKTTRKSKTKNNKSNTKTVIKNEFKNTTNTTNSTGGGRRANKDNKLMSAEEEQRRQIRRERNKMAAARCRKRRMDHTNELLEETEQLEDKRLRLQVEIQGLRQQKTNLQQMLAQHKCAVNINNRPVSNTVSTVNHTTSVLNDLSTIKQNALQQQNINTNINDRNVDDIIIKCENPIIDEDNKNDIDIIPTTVFQQTSRKRPTTLLELNSVNYGNNKKISGHDSSSVVLNFDSLMNGGTGLTPVSTNVGTVQNHQHRNTVSSGNNNVLS